HGDRTAVAGTKPVVLLFDRLDQRNSPAQQASVVLYKGRTLPSGALANINTDVNSEFPTVVTYPNVNEDAWTARALTESLWKQGVPKLSVLWMSDPDYSQHDSGPGSKKALRAIESCDHNLGVVLEALETKGARANTDVFVVSDHGFSTINHG